MEKELTAKRMWSVKIGNHVFVLHNGQVIYKRWVKKSGEKAQPSVLFGKNGWPNERIND